MGYLIVFAGAGIGGALRHGVNLAAARMFGLGFPLGTIIVNVLGSFLIGVLAGYFAYRTGVPQHLRLFLTTASSAASPHFPPSVSTRPCYWSATLTGRPSLISWVR